MEIKIDTIIGREIIDSRGNPTVEAEVGLSDGTFAKASVPSGASTGEFEAVELRDGEKRYLGKGVQRAVENINSIISPNLCCDSPFDQCAIDRMPVPMMNILNGGAHASNNIDIQEFMIMPVGAMCFSEGMMQCCEIYHTLGKILKENNMSTGVGDEGGYAPSLKSDEDAIEYIIKAIEKTGYTTDEIKIALDAASSEWYSDGKYILPKRGDSLSSDELINYFDKLCSDYPIISLEDPLSEHDWDGWQNITSKIGNKVQLVGDDLFVTNTKRLKKGIALGAGNAILIKINQIGTLTETLDAIDTAHKAGYRTIISHRSGETEDTTIADIAVAVNSGQIKTGAPCRTDRVAKYNRLLRIESAIVNTSTYGI